MKLKKPETGTSRRQFLKSAAGLSVSSLALAAAASQSHGAQGAPVSRSPTNVVESDDSQTARKVIVGAHPWVYAATQPGNDITPVLPQIFADMKYAGIEVIELAHEADFQPTRPLRESLKISRQFVHDTLGS